MKLTVIMMVPPTILMMTIMNDNIPDWWFEQFGLNSKSSADAGIQNLLEKTLTQP